MSIEIVKGYLIGCHAPEAIKAALENATSQPLLDPQLQPMTEVEIEAHFLNIPMHGRTTIKNMKEYMKKNQMVICKAKSTPIGER